MEAEQYNVFSRAHNLAKARNALRDEWVAAATDNSYNNFKQPTTAVIEAKADEFCTTKFMYNCTILEFSTEGAEGETYPVAIVRKPDGWLETVPVHNLRIMETVNGTV